MNLMVAMLACEKLHSIMGRNVMGMIGPGPNNLFIVEISILSCIQLTL